MALNSHLRGQGATEYLVLLAVVLIIALVSIALLGFFPGLASDAKITQSSSYWKSASPFAIIEHTAISSNGWVYLIVQNTQASGTYTLTSLNVSNGTDIVSVTFAPGEIKNISGIAVVGGALGSIYDFNVSISYTTPNGLSGRQQGAKDIVGKYS